MLPARAVQPSAVQPRFQSPPGHRAGCYRLAAGYHPALFRFQSPPGHRAGCYVRSRNSLGRTKRFNPHPAIGPGATSKRTQMPMRYRWFQSPPGHRAGCYVHSIWHRTGLVQFQSPPGHRAGCYPALLAQQPAPLVFQSPPGHRAGCYIQRPSQQFRCRYSFNPHPAIGPGATAMLKLIVSIIAMFQSPPGHRAGCYGSTN